MRLSSGWLTHNGTARMIPPGVEGFTDMAKHPISMFFGFLALAFVAVGCGCAYAVSQGPCLGDAECVAEFREAGAEPATVVVALR